MNDLFFLSSRELFTKSISHVDSGGGSLEDTESFDDRLRHAVMGLVDIEVAQRPIVSLVNTTGVCLFLNFSCLPLGLSTPVLVRRDLQDC